MSNARIAIDAMGGDHAPEEIVAGALLAAREHPGVRLILVGDEARIRPLLAGAAAGGIEIVHAPEAVPMDQSASCRDACHALSCKAQSQSPTHGSPTCSV